MDALEKVGKVAYVCGKKAAAKARDLGEIARLGKRLVQIKREMKAVYASIGFACWTEKRRETTQFFHTQFDGLSLLEEERRAVERRLRSYRGRSRP